MSRDASEPIPDSHRFYLSVRLCEVLLLLAASLLCYWRLDCPLQEPEETLYAEVPRQMLAANRFLVPVRHGQAYYDKPPLLYWLVMGVYQLCGVEDWAARLVPSTALFLSVLVSYAWGKRTLGPRAAFAGAMMLCLSPRFVQMGRMLTTNGLLTLWVTAALAAAHVAVAGPVLRRRWWLLSAALAGIGLLTKGPVALVLVAAPVAVYPWLDRRAARPGTWWWAVYLALAGLVAVPWFVIVALRDPVFVDYFFWTHHVRRFLDPIDHPQPPWYYLPLLFAGMLPWSLLFPGLIRHVWRRTAEARPLNGPCGFILLAGVWGLVFFSASGCKRPSYILPVMPPLALALGGYVDAVLMQVHTRRLAWTWACVLMFAGLFGAAELLLPAYANHFSLREHLLPQVERCHAETPVLCYPHGWDAVNYYLRRSDVHVYRTGHLHDMIAALDRAPESLVLVKTRGFLPEFLHALPPGLHFVEASRDGTVTVGWVRR